MCCHVPPSSQSGIDDRKEEFDSSSNILRMIKSRSIRWASHVARMGEGRNTFKILTDKLVGKLRHICEGNFTTDLKEI